MKIQAKKLDEAISKVSLWANRKSPLESVQGILAEGKGNMVSFSATDAISTDITMAVEVDGDVDFRICLPTDYFAKTISALSSAAEEISIAVGRNTTITSGGRETTIQPLDDAYFPVISREYEVEESIEISGREFAEVIKLVVSTFDSKNPYSALEGIYFSNGDVVSMDGFRLSVYEGFSFFQESVLIYGENLTKIAKAISEEDVVRVVWGDRRIYFIWEGGTISTTIIDYEYPNYRGIIPSGYASFGSVAKDELKLSINMASKYAEDSEYLLIAEIMDYGQLVLRSLSHVGTHRSEIECVVEGESVKFGISLKYLRDALARLSGDIEILVSDPTKLIVLRGDVKEYLYGIMPMAVKE